MRRWIIFAVVLIYAVIALPVGACGGGSELYLDMRRDVSGILVMDVVFAPSGIELCGLEADITYDADVLMLSSCERGEGLGGLEFDCGLSGGRIRLLLWGLENSSEGGVVATVGFVPLCDESDIVELSISLPTGSSAVCFRGDEIHAGRLEVRGLSAALSQLGGACDTGGDACVDTEVTTEERTEERTEEATEAESEKLTESEAEDMSEALSEALSEAESRFESAGGTSGVGGRGAESGRLRGVCIGICAVSSAVNFAVILPLSFCGAFGRRES